MHILETFKHLFHPRRSNNHRPKVLHPTAYVYYALIAIGIFGLIHNVGLLPGRLGGVLGFASSITPSQVVELTNVERSKVGLPPLTLNAQLNAAALSKGQDMFTDQYWAHTAPDGKEPWAFMKEAGYTYRVAGENLARDFSATPDMMAAWMASPTHKANVINNKYQEIGVAVIDGTLQGVETTLVVQMFGTPPTTIAQTGDASSTEKLKPVAVPINAGPAGQPAVADQVSNQQPAPGLDRDQEVSVTLTQPLQSPTAAVLAKALVRSGELNRPPLFSPLQMTKAFFLAVILLLILTLVYDGFIVGNLHTIRLVGKNLAHIIFLSVVGFLLILFKGGIIS